LVGGDRDGVLLLALGEDLEEELGAAAVEFHVAELGDHEEVDAAVPGDRLGGLLVVGGSRRRYLARGGPERLMGGGEGSGGASLGQCGRPGQGAGFVAQHFR
jgi:hypothetical protein